MPSTCSSKTPRWPPAPAAENRASDQRRRKPPPNMEYKVLYAQNFLSISKAIEKLVVAVNEAIVQGWEPVGGITVTDNGGMAQAMIKRR